LKLLLLLLPEGEEKEEEA